MEFTGKIKSVVRDYATNKFDITFSVNEDSAITTEYEKVKNVDKLRVSVKKYREKRSRDANAYMWSLLSDMADVLKTNKDDLYIEMLSKYGVFTHIIVKPNVVERVKAEWRIVRDLGEVTVNGTTGIQLQCYFGSSTYDTKEMCVLIDGVVNECKELNIETYQPCEIERMKKEWGI